MTAPTLPLGRYVDSDALFRRLRLGPAEGWLTVIAVALLSMTLGWSLDEAGWVPRVEGGTEYLPWVGAAATIVAVVLAKLGLGRWRTLVVAAAIGGVVLPFIAGNVVLANQAPPLTLDGVLARYRAAAG